MTELEKLREDCLNCRGCELCQTRTNVVFGVGSGDLDRTKVYIANMVKCRPPHNRDPLPAEQAACSHWLNRQLELIDPAIIVCLGRIAAMRFIRPDFKITREHGQWFEKDGRQVMAIYHPAALLRDPRKRPETFDDLKAIQAAYRAL